MKLLIFCLLILTIFFNLSCQKEVISSPISPNEQITELPQPTLTPDKYEEIDITKKFSGVRNDNQPTFLEYQDYKVEKVKVKKTDGDGNPKVDIYDAVVSKSGKRIATFEGLYNPLGNEMSFEFYSLTGESGKQLIVYDQSNRFNRSWVVSLSPKYEVLFDSQAYGIDRGGISLVDLDKDGVYELDTGTFFDSDLGLPNSLVPQVGLVFKYDSKAHQYFPANHKFADYCLENIGQEIQKFDEGNDKSFKDFAGILLTYIYAGKEEDAWKFFDEKFDSVSPKTLPNNYKEKQQIKLYILKALNKDPSYRFIKSDLKNKY